jgi:hypothetical protein
MRASAVASPIWRDISQRIIIGKGVKPRIARSGLASLAATTKSCNDPTALLIELRRSRDVPPDIYPVFARFDNAGKTERILALVHFSQIATLPIGTLRGEFDGRTISFICTGTPYEAGARKLLSLSPTLNSVPEELLSCPIELTHWLNNNRAAIAKECGEVAYSLGYLMQALSSNGKIPFKQAYVRLAGGLDLYLASPTLQSMPENLPENPIKLLKWLRKNQNNIQKETKKFLSLRSLMIALQAAKKVPHKQDLDRLTSGFELYYKTPVLQEGGNVFGSVEELIEFIDERRDFLPKTGKEGERISFRHAYDALRAAQRIAPGLDTHHAGLEVSAADYARRYEEEIGDAICEAVEIYLENHFPEGFNSSGNGWWLRYLNRSGFKRGGFNSEGKQLSNRYIRYIIKWARRLYANEEAQRHYHALS